MYMHNVLQLPHNVLQLPYILSLTYKVLELSPFSKPLLLVRSERLPLVLHGPVLTLSPLPQLHALYVGHLKRVEAKEVLPCLLSHLRLQSLQK